MRPPPRQIPDGLLCFGFLAPALAILLFMVAYPFVSLVWYSFLRFSALRQLEPAEFIGLDNYRYLMGDPDLWQRFVFTGKFVLLAVAVQFVAGIAVAHLLTRDFRGRDLLFTALMMPMMLCPIVVGFLWRYMFNSEWGLLNWLLTLVGLPKVDWLGVTQNALWAVVIADSWMWTPFVILLATAAFRGIPRTLYEAAGIDGAGAAFRFWRLTLPLSAPILVIALLLRLIDSFKQYDLFFALTGGGPGSTTETVSFALAKTAFGYFYTGEASALAVMLLVIITGLALMFVRYLNRLAQDRPG